jgi:uncharacterized protein YgiM (DUF1202 family)
MAEKEKKPSKFKSIAVVVVVLVVLGAIFSDDESSKKVYRYNIGTGNVNIRESGSTDAKVLGQIAPNEKVEVVSTGDKWTKIKFKDNEGFVFSKFLGWEKNQEYEKQKQAEQKRLEDQRRQQEEARCRQDLGCWGEKKSSIAAVYCPREVEKLAKYQAEWTDGILEPKFSHYRWKDKGTGIITYIGDKVKFQNGFGAWQVYTYECDVDTINETPLYVRAQPGRYN